MDISKIAIGKNPPKEVNVIIEVPMGGDPIKYEFDKEAGAIVVDRFVATPMRYPTNYGFVPHTLSGDGDPVDVLVICPYQLFPGTVIKARPIGVLMMEDQEGEDEKIIAVPTSKTTTFYDNIQEQTDVQPILLQQIEHFFTHYKDLEAGKWTKINGWESREKAEALILEGIERAKASK